MEGSVIKTKAVLAHQHLRGVNDQDKFGCLPIHYACQHSKEDTLELVQLVSQGCDVNTVALPTVCEDSSSPNDERDKPYLRARGQAPLHIASRAGNLDVMNFLLKNADPLLQNSVAQMQTPLHVACMCGNVDVAKLIMSECGDEICNVCDTYQCLPLHYACQHASLPLVKLVSKGCRVTALSCNEPTHGVCQKRALDEQNSACGQTPLHLASITGQSEVVKYLFEECLDDKYQYQHLCNCFGQTLLHVACLHGHMDIAKSLLLKCGFAMCKVKDLSGSLPEDYAHKHDSLKLLKLNSISRCTNKREAFEEWPDVFGQLHLACRSGVPELVEYLINTRKCNPEESFYDQTAFQLWPQSPDQLHTACKSGIPELVQYIYRDPKRQCDIKVKNDEGMVAFELWPKGKDQLHKACRSGVPELVKYLVNNRCCSMDELINDQRAFEMWPDGRYHDACKSGVVPLVKYLCENQRFVTSTEDHREQLPLHVACQEKSLEMVKLVSNECDVNTADTHGFTPLHIACKAGEIEIAMYLVSEKQASIKLKDRQGNIPFDLWPSSGDQLSRACAMGFPELTHYLIKQRRCEPSLRALELWPEGVDQLHKACKSGIPELVKYLTDERCCNKDELMNDQMAFELWPQTPEQLHTACKTGIAELVQHVYRDPKRQCDIEVKNSEGMVAFELWPKGKDQLHKACRSGVPELVKYLVNNRCCSMDELINDQKAFEMWPDGRYHDACKSGVVPLVKYLCESQRFVTSSADHTGQLPLHVACQEKSLEMVKLVSNECDVNTTDNNGFTPLHIACKAGEIEITMYLVSEKRASSMLKDTQGNIPFDLWPSSGDQLSRACAMGFPELTHYLIKQRRCEPSLRALELWPEGVDQLHKVCKSGIPELVKYLIDERCCNKDELMNDQIAFELWPQTPEQLHDACKSGIPELVQHIYRDPKRQCDIEFKNDEGMVAFELWPKGKDQLHRACRSGISELVKYLVNNRYCSMDELINDQKAFEMWPDERYHDACKSGVVPLVKYLCENQRFVTSTVDHTGQLPLHVACQEKSLEMIKLVSYECDVNTADIHGFTPLHIACKAGEIEIAMYLVSEKRASVMLKDTQGNIPFDLWPSSGDQLSRPCAMGFPELTHYLIAQRRCEPSLRALELWPEGVDQLHKACKSGIPELVKYLIDERCCNKDELVNDQIAFELWPQTPEQLHTACKTGIPELVQHIYRDPKRQCDIEFKNDEGMVAFELWPKGKDQLHRACRSGVPELVKYLVNNRYCSMDELINVQKVFEMWPDERYHDACKSGVVPLVKYLCENQRFVTSTVDHTGQLPLHVACQKKSLEMVKLVSNECDVNTTDNNGFTPLHIACKAGEIEIAMYLVSEKRASIMFKDTQGNIPFDLWPSSGDQLSRACAMGFPELTHYLIAQRRCEPSLRALELWPEGVDQLHKACKSGIPELVKYLTDERCCNKDELMNDQMAFELWPQTPEQLHDACKTGIPELVQHIYRDPKRQCDIEFKNDEGMVAFELWPKGKDQLHRACRSGVSELVKYLVNNRYCSMDELINDQKGFEMWPDERYHDACKSGVVPLVKYLCENQRFVTSSVDHTGQLPLHVACQEKSLEMVKLVSNECDVNTTDNNGFTPLHIACKAGEIEIAMYLVSEKQASIMLKDTQGNIPFDLWPSSGDQLSRACAMGFPELTHYLIAQRRCEPSLRALELWPEGVDQLHKACKSGIPELVKYLIDERCCNKDELVNDQIAFKLWPQTPEQLHDACKTGIPELVQHIYRDPKRQCDIEFKNDEGMVAFELWPKGKYQLHRACRSGVPELVKYLVNNRYCSMDELINDQKAFEMWPDGRYHDACKSGVVPLVKYLCENQKFVTSTVDHRGQLPLHVACQEKSLEMIKLVSYECNVNTADTHGFTPLHIACKAGEIEIAMYLVSEKQASIKLKDRQGNIPFDLWPSSEDQLSRACAMGFPELTHYLIKQRRCEPSLRALKLWPEGVDQLHKACKSGIPELVKYLVDKRSCDKDKLIDDQIAFELWPQTPEQLHDACKTGVPELVQHIYRDPKRQCDLEFKNSDGLVAFEMWPVAEYQLHRACESGIPELLWYLINGRKCDVTTIEASGKVAFDLWPDTEDQLREACRGGISQLVKYLVDDRKCGVVGCPYEVWPDGRYHDACRSGVVQLVRYLCDQQRFQTSSTDHRGQLPLHVACQEKSLEMVKLVSSECDVNTTDKDGHTPLHIACKYGEVEIATYLVSEKLASITLRDREDEVPFNLWPNSENQLAAACALGFPELTHYLLKQRKCEPSEKVFELWPNGKDQLHKACRSGIPELVKYLINSRACSIDELINDQIAFELWPQNPEQLHDACKTGIPELLQHVYQDPKRECNIEFKNSEGMVAFELWPKGNDQLQRACKSGVPELVHHLINHQKCTTSRKAFEMWPEGEEQFHSACKSGILELVKYLVQKRGCGKYINKAVDFEGSTPLHVVCDKVCPRDSCSSQYTDLIKFLTVHIHAKCAKHENTELPLHKFTCCKVTAANLKLDKERITNDAPCMCDIHIQDKNGELPLHIACRKLTLADVKLLSDFDKMSLKGVNTASYSRERPIDIVAQRISNEEEEEEDETTQETPQSEEQMSEAFDIMCFLVDKKKCNISTSAGEDNILLKVMTVRLKNESTTSKPEWMRLAKLMITGPPGVGKSSFREHLVQKRNLSSKTKTKGAQVTITKLTHMYAKATLKGLPWEELGIGRQIATLLKSKHGKALRKALIVHILDTGRQPGFHKLLPALVNGPAIYLVFFALHENLWDRSVRKFTREDSSLRYVTSYTPEDVILQTISTVSCFTQPKVIPASNSVESLLEGNSTDGNICSKGIEPVSSVSGNEPVCMLVGTHKDQVDDDQIEDVCEELENILEKVPNSTGLIKRYYGQIVAPISNMDLESGIGGFGTFLTSLVHEKCQNVEVQPEWLSFQLCVAQPGHDDVITLTKCREIAKNCGIEGDDFKDALTYLHYHVGSVLWYRQVNVYKKLVIVNIQSLYDSITDLMANTFTEDDPYYNDFSNKGQFTSVALHEKSVNVKGYFNFSNLIHLLLYLHIAACVSPLDARCKVYFMPSVLRSSGVELLKHPEGFPRPLLVHFDCGFCPVGMFGFFIVELLKCAHHKWQLCNNATRYSNNMLMRFGAVFDKVRLIEKSTFYEIWIEPDNETCSTPSLDYRERCFQVKYCIHESLQAIRRNLNYKKLSAHKFAFFCPRMKCQQRRNRIAVEEVMDRRELMCLACKNPTPVPDACKLWYGERLASLPPPTDQNADIPASSKLYNKL